MCTKIKRERWKWRKGEWCIIGFLFLLQSPKMPKEVKHVKVEYVRGNTPVYYPGSLFTSPLDADHPLVRFLRNQRPGAGPWNANLAEDLGHGALHTRSELEEHQRRSIYKTIMQKRGREGSPYDFAIHRWAIEALEASERRQAGRIAPCICYRKRVLLDLQEHHPEAAPYITGMDDSVTVPMAQHFPDEKPRFRLPPPGGIPPLDMEDLHRAQARAATGEAETTGEEAAEEPPLVNEEPPLFRVPSRREFRPRFAGQPEPYDEDEDDWAGDDMALIAARPQLLDAISSSSESSGDRTPETAGAALGAIMPRIMELLLVPESEGDSDSRSSQV